MNFIKHLNKIKNLKHPLHRTTIYKDSMSSSFVSHFASSLNLIKNSSRKVLLPVLKQHTENYPTPTNIGFVFNFGFLAGICLGIQILSGLFLTMHYTPHTDFAFNSVEHIMRDVQYGWFMRYLHANTASMFFICLYIHIGKALYYRSYSFPKYPVWSTGIVIFILTMATAFLGYVLPWGQMSYWGATVITSLFTAIPALGEAIVFWLWGGFSISNATLNRFFALHFLLPFIIAGMVVLHLVLLHKAGSTNPGSNATHLDLSGFLAYFIPKDLIGLMFFLMILTFLVFFEPNLLGHPDNYIPANPLVTPAHIVPEWYFLPFYAILRSIPDKLGGVLLMFLALLILFVVPFFGQIIQDVSLPSRYRIIFKSIFWFFVANFLLLGWVGGKPIEEPFVLLGRFCTLFYFSYLIIIIPILEILESKAVLQMMEEEWNFTSTSK